MYESTIVVEYGNIIMVVISVLVAALPLLSSIFLMIG